MQVYITPKSRTNFPEWLNAGAGERRERSVSLPGYNQKTVVLYCAGLHNTKKNKKSVSDLRGRYAGCVKETAA